MVEYNAATARNELRYGSVRSFTAPSSNPGGYTAPGILANYEVPAIPTLSGQSTTGTYSSLDDEWTRYYTTASNQQVATHTFTHPSTNQRVRNYTVFYDGGKFAPRWTAHAVHSSMWPDNDVGRTGSWQDDPAISLTQQSGVSGSYSRGHLVASNDRQSSRGQNGQTFYHSNQAPQYQTYFNDGIWNSLEQAIKAHAPSGRDTIYVVTGVLYEGTIQYLSSGSLSVPIPSHFYKCIMECTFNASGAMTDAKGIAYVYTNEAHSGTYYYNSQFVCTIDAMEERTGIDFFPNVPAALQEAAEATATALWSY